MQLQHSRSSFNTIAYNPVLPYIHKPWQEAGRSWEEAAHAYGSPKAIQVQKEEFSQSFILSFLSLLIYVLIFCSYI